MVEREHWSYQHQNSSGFWEDGRAADGDKATILRHIESQCLRHPERIETYKLVKKVITTEEFALTLGVIVVENN